jgi:hypothetical protein
MSVRAVMKGGKLFRLELGPSSEITRYQLLHDEYALAFKDRGITRAICLRLVAQYDPDLFVEIEHVHK